MCSSFSVSLRQSSVRLSFSLLFSLHRRLKSAFCEGQDPGETLQHKELQKSVIANWNLQAGKKAADQTCFTVHRLLKSGGWKNTFSLWCLNPAVVFKSIAESAQSVIITSGCLLQARVTDVVGVTLVVQLARIKVVEEIMVGVEPKLLQVDEERELQGSGKEQDVDMNSIFIKVVMENNTKRRMIGLGDQASMYTRGSCSTDEGPPNVDTEVMTQQLSSLQTELETERDERARIMEQVQVERNERLQLEQQLQTQTAEQERQKEESTRMNNLTYLCSSS